VPHSFIFARIPASRSNSYSRSRAISSLYTLSKALHYSWGIVFVRSQAQRLVHLKISTKTIKTLEKKGLQAMADEAVSCQCFFSSRLCLMRKERSSLFSQFAENVWPSARQGINLWKLPYTDVSENRKAYLAANPLKVPVAKDDRKMKNAEKLAASTKKPMEGRYLDGRIIWVRSSSE
jgi:hypothetical protein